jgi:MOSC domain-containing protein YiiM
MKLLRVNLGQERILQRKDRVEKTGIFKIPTSEPVWLSKLGLQNDVIISKKHHGGPDQAVYAYGTVDYAWWTKELGKEILPGTFGENLTISEMESTLFNIGDYLHIGNVTLQVTAPRIPCKTFAARMEDPQWVKKFRHADRPGLYCRVIKEGFVQTDDTVSVEKYAGQTISILEMYRDYYIRDKTEEMIRRQLAAPIDIRSRKSLGEELQNLVKSRD